MADQTTRAFFEPVPAIASGPLCFRHLVMPIRVCHGSVLSRVWSQHPDCSGGNAVALAVVEGIFRAYGRHMPTRQAFTGPIENTVVSRSAAGGRHSHNMPAVIAALQTLPNVFVHEVLLERLTMALQLELFSNTDILMGAHGAGLSNVIFLPPRAALLEFTSHPPPSSVRSIANIFWKMAEWTNHGYASVVGAAALDPQAVRQAVEGLIARGRK